jgi:hypothetical protein
MLALVIVLVITNLLALAALAWAVVRPPAWLTGRWPAPDGDAAAALDGTPRPPVPKGSTRRLISIEILNPIELAGTRGRLVGLAGTLAPGLTRRIVYDQTLRILRQQLVDQQVLADVRLHTLRPAPAPGPSSAPSAVRADTDGSRPRVQDTVQTIDIDVVDDRPN